MADMLYTRKQVLNLLHKNGVATFKASSFSEAVKIGKIPYRKEKGFNGKVYCYEDVRDAIIKAGIGGKRPETFKTLSTPEKLEVIADPKDGETPQEYGEAVVKEIGSAPTLTDANIYKAIYQGKLEKIKYEKEKGLVVNKEVIEAKAFKVARTIRDKIMSIPERLSNELASISDPHTVKELLFKEFEKLLDGFSAESFYDE